MKSDDVQGRVATYEAIVKGEPIEEPGLPASFRVLVKELQSLGLAVEASWTTVKLCDLGKTKNGQTAKNGNGAAGFGRGLGGLGKCLFLD